MSIRYIFVDKHAGVIDALRMVIEPMVDRFPAGKCTVEFHVGDVAEYAGKRVCLVNPGNSVGVMTGELDSTYNTLMPGIDEKVLQDIERFGNKTRGGQSYLPIGSAVLTPHRHRRWLLTAPCMWTGMHVGATRNAFHAMMAILSFVLEFNRFMVVQDPLNYMTTVVVPGICTGQRRMLRLESAKQVGAAFSTMYLSLQPMRSQKFRQEARIMWSEPNIAEQPDNEESAKFKPLQIIYRNGGSLGHG